MINGQIRDKEVRVIGENGDQLGIMSSREAMKLAQEAELDLVKIAPKAQPPVCKIIDYGKYRYELARKEKEAKKKQKTVEVKEVRLSPNILSLIHILRTCLCLVLPRFLQDMCGNRWRCRTHSRL